MAKKEKLMSNVEKVGVVTFSVLILTTQQAQISMILTFLITGLFFIINNKLLKRK